MSSELPVDRSLTSCPLNIRSLSIIGAAAVVFALPMLVYGPMLQGYDTREHLNYSRYFSEQFWAGEWYPRWLIGIHHGLGSPSLFVYPPLPSYVYALLEPAGKLFGFNSFRLGEFLALFVSGICAFLWLSTMTGRRAATTGAVLYMLMPYHLAVDYYRRTALAECWALAWIPLVLYFSARVIRRERASVIGLAVAYALLILSNVVSVLISSFIPLAAALALSAKGQKLNSAFRIAAGMLLGVGLSCFYFLPALFHAKYFPVSRLPIWSYRYDYLFSFGTVTNNPNRVVREIALGFFDLLAFCAICGAAVLAKGSTDSRKRIAYWLAIGMIPAFLMTSLSAPIWRPILFEAIQFPWRFNIVLCVAALPIFAAFVGEWPRLPRLYKAWSLVLLAAVLTPWLVEYGAIWRSYRGQTEPARRVVNEGDGWFYAWAPPGMDESRALQASIGPQVRFLTGMGTANVLLWKPRHIEFQTNSSTGGWVMINQFYFPLWRSSASPDRVLDTKAVMPEGLLELQVPPGPQQIQVEIPIGRPEQIGWWLSLSSALLCVAWAAVAAFEKSEPPHGAGFAALGLKMNF